MVKLGIITRETRVDVAVWQALGWRRWALVERGVRCETLTFGAIAKATEHDADGFARAEEDAAAALGKPPLGSQRVTLPKKATGTIRR